MPRPLIQHGVAQLEEMFANGKADAKLLKQLEHELQYRQAPRAVTLLTKVQTAMCGMGAASPPARPTVPISQQANLWERPTTPPAAAIATPICTVTLAVNPLDPQPATNSTASPVAMSLKEAYKVLKATPGAPWESIEQTRRTLVYQSHPSRLKGLSLEKHAQVLAEAKRINAAYAALSQVRCRGRAADIG